MTQQPLISVIMSVYNEQLTDLQQAVTSILNQTLPDFEFIILLDNPQQELLHHYLITLSDARVRLVVNEHNMGLARSLTKGIQLAKGKLIARMDADDVSDPTRFAEEYAYLQEQDLDLVTTNARFIDEKGKVIGQHAPLPTTPEQFKTLLPYGCNIVHPSVLGKKSLFVNQHGYRELPASEDYDLWLRCLTSDAKIGGLNKRLFSYRIRGNSMTQSNLYRTFRLSTLLQEYYSQRLKQGYDEFSPAHVQSYFQQYRVTDAAYCQQFAHQAQGLSQVIQAVKHGHFLAVARVLHNLMQDKNLRDYAKQSVRYRRTYQQVMTKSN